MDEVHPPEQFRIHSIRNRIIFVVTLTLILLTAALTWCSFLSYQADARNRSAFMLQDTTEQVAENVRGYFEEISSLSMQVYYNSTIMQILNADPTDDAVTNLENRRIVQDELRRLFFLGRNDVISCYIIGPDVYRAADKVGDLEIDRDWEQSEWYRQALEGRNFSMLISDPGDRQTICSIVRTISSSRDYSKTVAVMKINYNASGIAEICRLVQPGYSGQLCVLNENDTAVFGTLPEGMDPDAVADGISYLTLDQEYLFNQVSINPYGWRVLMIHPLKTLEAGAYQTLRRMLAISALILAAVSLVIYSLLQAAFAPLTRLIDQMNRIRRGNENTRMTIRKKDEIGYLALAYNEMLDRIRNTQEENTRLMKQVYESQLLQEHIRMQLLTKQIRPHFIMNTLNMIAIEAEMGEIERCTENIRRLSVLLQTAAYSNSVGTLEKEINCVRSYLQLYQERYCDRLSFSIQIPDELLSIPFPMLLLQPIVENSLLHGCEKTSGECRISITTETDGSDVLITTEDDAGGIPADRLAEIRQRLSSENPENADGGGGIGLVNVQQRIRLIYGAAYGLQIDSENGTTRVTMRISREFNERILSENVQSDRS